MSASNPRKTGAKNPAIKFIRWKGGEEQGWFEYYDKDIVDPKLRNVRIELDRFLVLDKDLFSITGFIDETKTAIISNAVRGMDDKIVVKSYKDKKSAIVLSGTYAELRDEIRGSKIYKYTKEIYILFKGELCHLALAGTAFKSWIDTVEPNSKHWNSWIGVVEVKEGKKGIVKFNTPIFGVFEEAGEEDWNQVLHIDSTILQPFLEEYLKREPSSSSNSPSHSEKEIDTADWRNVVTPSGSKLGEMSIGSIEDLNQSLVEQDKTDSDLYQYVGHAIYEYQQVAKEWDKKKDKDGKLLKDYTLSELQTMYGKIVKANPFHVSKLLIEAAIEAMSSVPNDDDDIPF